MDSCTVDWSLVGKSDRNDSVCWRREATTGHWECWADKNPLDELSMRIFDRFHWESAQKRMILRFSILEAKTWIHLKWGEKKQWSSHSDCLAFLRSHSVCRCIISLKKLLHRSTYLTPMVSLCFARASSALETLDNLMQSSPARQPEVSTAKAIPSQEISIPKTNKRKTVYKHLERPEVSISVNWLNHIGLTLAADWTVTHPLAPTLTWDSWPIFISFYVLYIHHYALRITLIKCTIITR